MNGNTGKTTGDKLFFIQQVINRVNSDIEGLNFETKKK